MTASRKINHIAARAPSPQLRTHAAPRYIVAQALSCYCQTADTISICVPRNLVASARGALIHNPQRCVEARARVNRADLTLRQISDRASAHRRSTRRFAHCAHWFPHAARSRATRPALLYSEVLSGEPARFAPRGTGRRRSNHPIEIPTWPMRAPQPIASATARPGASPPPRPGASPLAFRCCVGVGACPSVPWFQANQNRSGCGRQIFRLQNPAAKKLEPSGGENSSASSPSTPSRARPRASWSPSPARASAPSTTGSPAAPTRRAPCFSRCSASSPSARWRQIEIPTDAAGAAGRRGLRQAAFTGARHANPGLVEARGNASTQSLAARAVIYPARRGASHRASFAPPAGSYSESYDPLGVSWTVSPPRLGTSACMALGPRAQRQGAGVTKRDVAIAGGQAGPGVHQNRAEAVRHSAQAGWKAGHSDSPTPSTTMLCKPARKAGHDGTLRASTARHADDLALADPDAMKVDGRAHDRRAPAQFSSRGCTIKSQTCTRFALCNVAGGNCARSSPAAGVASGPREALFHKHSAQVIAQEDPQAPPVA